jgi:transposase, IS30 family
LILYTVHLMASKSQYHHLSLEERHTLASYLHDSLSLRSIAEKLGRSPGTISEEIKRNSPHGNRETYDPYQAHLSSVLRIWEANSRNPLKSDSVRKYVIKMMTEEQWSPEQISNRMMIDFPNDETMRISHETIYHFANSKEGKELGLIRHLRRGKPRKIRQRYKPKGMQSKVFIDVKSIHERSKDISLRQRFGDWETDTMEGNHRDSAALSVQRDRKSRHVCLTKMNVKNAKETHWAITKRLKAFPAHMRRSLTYDRGTENANYKKTERVLGCNSFFCDPYSSWQKGSVEQIIGFIRQYIPKGTGLSDIAISEIREIERKLNNRPMKCLGWRTPSEVLSAHLCKSQSVRLRA